MVLLQVTGFILTALRVRYKAGYPTQARTMLTAAFKEVYATVSTLSAALNVAASALMFASFGHGHAGIQMKMTAYTALTITTAAMIAPTTS